jgi:hypothetical protein
MSLATHVVPVGDTIAHELSDECVCGPDQELVEDDAGGYEWLLTHHSLDGRERAEQS